MMVTGIALGHCGYTLYSSGAEGERVLGLPVRITRPESGVRALVVSIDIRVAAVAFYKHTWRSERVIKKDEHALK